MERTEPTSAVKPASKPRKPRPKPERLIRILEQPTVDTDGWGAVQITVGKQRDTYLVHFIPSDFGFGAIGFEVEKLDADLAVVESYHVHLSDRPEHCSCDCKGHDRWGHCKHKDGIGALVKLGKFPRLYTARDARHDPEPAEPPQLDEAAYFDPSDLNDPA
jgi:hypothetical protein